MKRIALFATFALLFIAGNAQVKTYRQNINQKILKLVVKGNCVVYLQQDTCDWVSYKGPALPETAQLVVVEGNTLTTTEAANGKIIHVGTTAGRTEPVEFTVDDDAIVLYQDKYYTNCRASSISTNMKDQPTSPARDWTGLKKYKADQRLHWDFFLGTSTWTTPGLKFGSEQYPTKFGSMLTHTGFQTGYSLYMDDHIAAGIGAGFTVNNNTFNHPHLDYTNGNNSLIDCSSTLPGKWITTATTFSLGVPLHFVFYPNKTKHWINMQVELIPQIAIMQYLNQNYTHEQDGFATDANYRRDLPFSLFNLTTRFSLNLGMIGAYAEANLLPLSRDLHYMGNSIAPHNIAFGVRLNLFELLD